VPLFPAELIQALTLSFKKNIDAKVGTEIAVDFLGKTRDLYSRAEIAGSLRRREPVIHDIDLAVIPKTHDILAWEGSLKERVLEIGGFAISLGDVICNFRFRGVQVNLFVCTNEAYWGVLYMWATGPKGHTIGMNIKAGKMGLHLSPKGLFTKEEEPKLIPTLTEEDVARILNWKYKPPEFRGRKYSSNGNPS
jgi:DNA polymerase (family X)